MRSVHIPHVEYAQGAMVVNYPGHEYPFIRIHETKHASGQQCEGTVLGFEFTNAPTRYYPIELPENRALNDRYQNYIRDALGRERTYFAGRLANYLYIDMDDCMRQALDCAQELIGDQQGRVERSATELGPPELISRLPFPYAPSVRHADPAAVPPVAAAGRIDARAEGARRPSRRSPRPVSRGSCSRLSTPGDGTGFARSTPTSSPPRPSMSLRRHWTEERTPSICGCGSSSSSCTGTPPKRAPRTSSTRRRTTTTSPRI